MSDDGPRQTGTTQVVKNEAPWEGQQPYLTTGFERAREQLDEPAEFYPNSTVVPYAPQTEVALGLTEQRALGGSPLLRAGQGALQDTAEGRYLNANPHLQNAINAASQGMVRNYATAVAPGLNSQFSGAGRYGSNQQREMHNTAQQNLARELGNVSSQMSYRDYENERQNMLRAGVAAPQVAAADYVDYGQLERVGGMREGKAADELQEQIARFNYEQTSERDALDRYMALVAGGSYGGNTVTQQPLFQDRTSNTLGNIATVAGIGGSLFGSGGAFPNLFSF
jgi:hypothetical protein